MRRKKNYAMMKLNFPKRVTLPSGRTFVARYKRIRRDQLPPNIVMRRTYTQIASPRGRKRRQRGLRIVDFVKKSCVKSLSSINCKKRSRICTRALSQLDQKSKK